MKSKKDEVRHATAAGISEDMDRDAVAHVVQHAGRSKLEPLRAIERGDESQVDGFGHGLVTKAEAAEILQHIKAKDTYFHENIVEAERERDHAWENSEKAERAQKMIAKQRDDWKKDALAAQAEAAGFCEELERLREGFKQSNADFEEMAENYKTASEKLEALKPLETGKLVQLNSDIAELSAKVAELNLKTAPDYDEIRRARNNTGLVSKALGVTGELTADTAVSYLNTVVRILGNVLTEVGEPLETKS